MCSSLSTSTSEYINCTLLRSYFLLYVPKVNSDLGRDLELLVRFQLTSQICHYCKVREYIPNHLRRDGLVGHHLVLHRLDALLQLDPRRHGGNVVDHVERPTGAPLP